MENKSISLVSIITRSMDRPTLAEALDSVSKQTYPNIEVILVNARGGTHSRLANHCGTFPLHMVGTGAPLTRSSAANLGLDNATGKFALFLDDDDWLMTEHISKLVSVLHQSVHERVAYSAIKFASSPDSTEFSVINEDFDAVKLKRGNFMPIHAVLFDRELAASGCRFDEALNIYEDWDFWLQLSRLSRFLHLNEVTAGYRNTGDSGANPLADEYSIQAARAMIFEKWRNVWSGAEFNKLLAYASQIPDSKLFTLEARLIDLANSEAKLQRVVDENRTAINELERQLHVAELKAADLKNQKQIIETEKQSDNVRLAKQITDANTKMIELQVKFDEKTHQVHERDMQVQQVYASTSWRMTAPLRKLKMFAGKRIRSVEKLIVCLQPLVRKPQKIYPTVTRLKNAWQAEGMNEAKKVILDLPNDVTYQDLWVNQYRRSFNPEISKLILERIGNMKHRPLISILMPTYNTPEKLLRKALNSVKAQLYPSWELCVADDASTLPHVRRVLKEYANSDVRIKIKFSEHNAGVSTATNLALEAATGEFVALFDHDDILEPQAMFRLAESILEENPDIIYSDEAIMSDAKEEIINHVHRPVFSPEYLRACPYIVHLVAFKAVLLRQIGGHDKDLRISQDYDLILRASEKAGKIVHIPEILYLWRHRKKSTGHMLKSDVMKTSRGVLSRHLKRCEESGIVEDGAQFNYFNVSYPLGSALKVAIIIPTKNHGELVQQCIESIVRTTKGIAYDIILIDHASDDEFSLSYFEQLKAVHQVLHYEGDFNFSVINNWAVSKLQGEFTHYLFCNNDIEAMEDGWLEKMVALCQKPDVGLVGAKLLYPDRKMIQHAGVCVGMHGIAEHYGKFMDNVFPNGELHPGYHGTLMANHEMSAVTAACALMRKDVFERVGGYEENLAVGFGDVDLCLKTRAAGYRILFCADAVLIHHESYTRGKSRIDPHPEDSVYFSKKWRATLDVCDPYYNPNLTLQSTKWEAAQPLKFNLDIRRRIWERSNS